MKNKINRKYVHLFGRKIKMRFSGAENEKENKIRSASNADQ